MYAMKFEMCERPWRAAVIIFDDGQTKLHRHRLNPDSPVLVQVEGIEPTAEQVSMCRHLWSELYERMDFRVATFCPRLLPHSQAIMAATKIPA